LRPSAPITQVRYVYVLRVRPSAEREALEAQARAPDEAGGGRPTEVVPAPAGGE
jgi:hypothetical protein